MTKTITFNSTFTPALSTSSHSNVITHTVEGLSIAEVDVYKASSYSYMMFNKNSGFLYNLDNLGTIKSVSVTYTNGTSNTGQVGVYFGNSVQSTRNTSSNNLINQGGTQTWTNSTTGYGYFQVSSSNKNVQITKIAITYDDSGSSTGLNDPSISFSGLTAGGTTVTATINPDENASATYYRIGETGDYTEYSTPVDIDLTENASPIKVYAYSTNGTNTTDPIYQEFIVPALGVSISPSSYTGYSAQTVTITPSNYVGDYAITYTINGGTDIDYSAPFTLSDPGTYEIVASILDERASGSAVTSNTATITINQGTTYTLPFTETFNGTEGHGGNDGVWSGNTATSTIVYDKPGWSVTQNWGGDACIRLGTSSVHGSITSPTITGLTIGQTYTLTFKAAPWGTTSTVMDVSASGATVSGLPTEAMATEQWNEFELTLTATATSTTITFNSDQNRFWLDEINIAAPLPEGDYYLVGDFNNWTQQDQNYKFTANADGNFYLNGVTITDGQQFKIMKGSTWCGGPTDNSQYCEVTSGWHTDMGIIVDGGSNYNMASGGTCYFIISDRNLLTVQKAPVAIRGDHNNWSETDMTATETGWTIDNLNLVEGNEFQFIDGWNVYHGGAGAHILVNYLGVPLDMGTSGNYYVTVPGKYTITVNRWLNKMTADVERNTHNITCVATPNGGGSVSATVGGSAATSAKYVDEVTINTTPSNGYTLSDVVVTGNTSGNTITVTDNKFMMPDEDVTITATFVAGSYAITVVSPNGTTTCPATATVGQTVSFTVNPNDGYTVNTVTASFVNNNGGTTPVTVTEANGTYSFGMPPFPVIVTVTYTKQSSGGDGEWTLVTDESQLVEGNEYIIVSRTAMIVDGSTETTNVALKVNTENNYQDATDDIELSEDNLTATTGEDVTIFTLFGQEGAWKLGVESDYLYLNSNNNRLFFGSPSTESNSEATITIDENNNYKAFIVFNDYAGSASSPRYIQQYNNNNAGTRSARFSTYTSSQEPVYLYFRGASAVAKPVINPASKVFTEEFDATITCSTQGATIYYTTDGTDPTTSSAVYSSPIHVDKTMTIKAIAAKDGETSTIAEAVYQCTMVENIAEYLKLPIGTDGIVFKNPVVVQYHYISSSGKSYIYVKDDTGCAYFHQPSDGETIAQLENGDVIGARFYGDKDYDEAVNGVSQYSMFTNLENFAATGNKALAEPELKTVSDIIASNAAELNNHYITINKVKLSDLYQALSYGGAKYFDIYDETGTIGQDHIGYNKFNIDYESVVDDTDAFYNITGIFTAYNNLLEFHPTEIVKWAEKEVTLADLCENGEEGVSYKITNNLQGVVAVGTSLWVKDENGQSIHKVSPTAPYTDNFEIEHGDNTRSVQANYDQSNWCEIVFPDAATAKSFENSIIEGYSIEGVFNNKTNPKLTLSSSAQVKKYGTSDLYAPNFYLPANFVGSQSCNTDQYGQEGHGDFFFMTPKPQEYAMVVWAVYDGLHEGQPTFIMSPDKSRNSHLFIGEFIVDLSMNDGVTQTGQIKEGYGYDFEAIIRKVEPNTGNAPALRDVQNDQSASYIVYPLNLDEGQDPVTSINDITNGNGEIKSVKYVNVAGIVSDVPFQGVNIVVTEYTDGSRTTTKMLRK